jgi:DHA1 family bicyclomycin/chloramphenicol resistance-like MFS transporter
MIRKSHKHINKSFLLIVLSLLISLGPITIYVYLPAFIDIAGSFEVATSKVQLTLTFYLIGIVLGQISYGPIIDRYGKKPPLVFGLTLYTLSSLGCYFSQNIEQVIILRLLQAIGGCCAVVICRAIVRDIYSTQRSAQVFSNLILVSGLTPILAPFIGNAILSQFDWRFIFLVLTVFGLLCLILSIIFIPETKGFDHQEKIHHALKKYYQILKDKNFVANSLAGGSLMACLMSYMTISAFLYLQFFKVSTTNFSIIFSINAGSFILFAQLNNLLLKKFSIEQITDNLIYVPLTAGILLILSGFFYVNIITISILIFVLVGMCGAISPNVSALAMSNQLKYTGSASALFGTIQFSIASVFSSITNYFFSDSALPSCIAIGSAGILCFLIRKFLAKKSYRLKAIRNFKAIPLSQVQIPVV